MERRWPPRVHRCDRPHRQSGPTESDRLRTARRDDGAVPGRSERASVRRSTITRRDVLCRSARASRTAGGPPSGSREGRRPSAGRAGDAAEPRPPGSGGGDACADCFPNKSRGTWRRIPRLFFREGIVAEQQPGLTMILGRARAGARFGRIDRSSQGCRCALRSDRPTHRRASLRASVSSDRSAQASG
jgi:hypothetical protein